MRSTVQKHSQAKASPTAGPQQGVPTVTEREPSSLSLSLMIAPLVRSPDGRRGAPLGRRGCLRVVLKGPCMTASGYIRSSPTNLRCCVGFRELLLLSDHVSRRLDQNFKTRCMRLHRARPSRTIKGFKNKTRCQGTSYLERHSPPRAEDLVRPDEMLSCSYSRGALILFIACACHS